ncbi:MAG: hypothetical protein SFU91_05155 [Chloroherpetonaceae bacterium]|nr:hypothetical protein [Chloroherpetonaceae bacterium]
MRKVLIIGNKGNFGNFLEKSILPSISDLLQINLIKGCDIDVEFNDMIETASEFSDIIICINLGNYHKTLKKIIPEFIRLEKPITFWLVPSLQYPSFVAIKEFDLKRHRKIDFVLLHPMYGPQSFSNSTFNSRTTFQTIVTYVTSKKTKICLENVEKACQAKHNLSFQYQFTPESHDFEVAKTQGLVFAFALTLLEHKKVANEFQSRFPKQFAAFLADKALMSDFIALNIKANEIFSEFKSMMSEYNNNQVTLEDYMQCYCRLNSIYNSNSKNEVKITTESYLTLTKSFCQI